MHGQPLHTITDKVLPLSDVFPWDELAAQEVVLDTGDDTAMMAAANALLRMVLPAPDPQVDWITAILRVRSLQQLFSEYVGVSPKWVIRRFRLHEAADRLAQGADVDLAVLAQGLGYFDQAHFTSDFRRLVGKSPGRYREEARQAAGA